MKVSVLIITYNHERFIAQALDSVLMQQVNFDYEIVVGEDCSTDGTREILLAYQERFPDKIRLLLPDKNLGMIANLMQTYVACHGEFIAMLEGDDFWTSPYKLQQQVHFLENHPECSECFHNVDVIAGECPDQNHLYFTEQLKPFYKLDDIIASNFIPTCSVLFRSENFTHLPDWFANMPMGDWPLHILNAEHGLLGYLPEVMAAYRVHEGGLWSGSSRLAVLEKSFNAISIINRQLDYRYKRIINNTIRGWEREAVAILLADKECLKAVVLAARSFIKQPRRQFGFFIKSCISAIIIAIKRIAFGTG